jgi:hypothetical protein
MKTLNKISLVLFLLLMSSAGFAQNQNNTIITDSLLKDLADALEDLSDYYVMKVEDKKFKVETIDGNDITQEVNALKSPNGADLLIYDAEVDWTSVCHDFYSVNTFNDEWIPTDLMPESPTRIYWVYSNDNECYYLIKFGKYLDMSKYSLKSSATNNNDVIVSENGVEKYIIRDVAGKTRDEFYPLELLDK